MAVVRKKLAKKVAKKSSPGKAVKAAENKTKPTKQSVTGFIKAVENDTRRRDANTLLAMMKKITGEKAKMWGPSIIGFGNTTISMKVVVKGIC